MKRVVLNHGASARVSNDCPAEVIDALNRLVDLMIENGGEMSRKRSVPHPLAGRKALPDTYTTHFRVGIHRHEDSGERIVGMKFVDGPLIGFQRVDLVGFLMKLEAAAGEIWGDGWRDMATLEYLAEEGVRLNAQAKERGRDEGTPPAGGAYGVGDKEK